MRHDPLSGPDGVVKLKEPGFAETLDGKLTMPVHVSEDSVNVVPLGPGCEMLIDVLPVLVSVEVVQAFTLVEQPAPLTTTPPGK